MEVKHGKGLERVTWRRGRGIDWLICSLGRTLSDRRKVTFVVDAP